MEDVRTLQKQLLDSNLFGQFARLMASLLIQGAGEPRDEFCRMDVLHRQKILTHSYGIADAQTALRRKSNHSLLLRNPVGPGIQLSVVRNEIAIVSQRVSWQPKASTRGRLISPARKQTVELIVDVGIPDDVAGSVCQQHAFHSPDLLILALFSVVQTEEFEQVVVPAFADRIVQLAHLAESFRQDFKLDGIIRRMFDERVAGLELKLAREFADAQHDRPTEPAALAEDRVHGDRRLQARLHRTFRENDIGVEQLRHILLHDLEGTFSLRLVKGKQELVEAVVRQSELREQRPPNPAEAIVGSQHMVFHHQHSYIRLLDHHLAGGNQDAEIDDGGLRPVLEALGDGLAVVLVHEVEPALLGRTACPYYLYGVFLNLRFAIAFSTCDSS